MATVEHAGTAIEDLDCIGEEGLDRRGMVPGDARHVVEREAIEAQRDAVAGLPANLGPPGKGALVAVLDPGQPGKRLAQRLRALLLQRLAGKHAGRGAGKVARAGDLFALSGNEDVGVAGRSGQRSGIGKKESCRTGQQGNVSHGVPPVSKGSAFKRCYVITSNMECVFSTTTVS